MRASLEWREPDLPAKRRLLDGLTLGKRLWLVARDSEGFVVLRPGVGRILLCRLPPEFEFTTANRARLIAYARQWRNTVVRLDGPAGHA